MTSCWERMEKKAPERGRKRRANNMHAQIGACLANNENNGSSGDGGNGMEVAVDGRVCFEVEITTH